MSIPSNLLLKWLDATHPLTRDYNFVVTNHCVLAALNKKGDVLGLVLAEPRSLTQEYVDRLVQRSQRDEFMDCHFVLFLPPYLKHRAEQLLQSKSGLHLELRFTPFVHIKNAGRKFVLREKMRVMSVDDSAVLLKFLLHSMEALGFVEVVGQCSDPTKAVQEIMRLKPDVVTLDIQMPRKTGVEVVKDLLEHTFFPVVMISSLELEEGSLVFEALMAGAMDYLQKPKIDAKKEFIEELSEKLLTAVSGKKIKISKISYATNENVNYGSNLIWCLGSSTGGTQALTTVFTSMPAKIPPTLIVQHIPPIFSKSFADSLNNLCPFTVKEAEHGEPFLENHVYIAPGGQHMCLERKINKYQISLSDSPPVNRFRPSVDFMFNKMAQEKELKIVAALLTGMGKDGAEGLLALRKAGAETLAQDEDTSAVFGMPRAAIEIGAASQVVPLERIAQAMLNKSTKMRAAG